MAASAAATRHLQPFHKGDERAREAGRKSAAVRAARKSAERADAAAMVAELRTLAEHAEGVDVPATCIGVAMWALGRVTSGAVPLRHGGDVAELVRVLVDVARLVSGQSTSNAVVAHVSASEARARLAELRQLVDGVSSAAAVAAEDPAPDAGSGG